MKKLVLLASVFCFAYTANAAEPIDKDVNSEITVTSEWTKAKDGTWEGKHDGKTVWYKLNAKDASVWWSTDGKKWDAVKDGMWQDKEGKWLKIVDAKMLKWSADGGKTWADVPEWKWEGSNGTWYKFDKDWTLWSMGGKM
ncbi:MAG: hypothetical protein M3R27_10170 [Bacteroidota bacterium]|nr:hypothetical protein [Bacteroidota bacterium]